MEKKIASTPPPPAALADLRGIDLDQPESLEASLIRQWQTDPLLRKAVRRKEKLAGRGGSEWERRAFAAKHSVESK